MRKFLLTIFWITNVGNVIQLIIMLSASWILFSGAHTFGSLDVNVFLTQYVPWLLWIKTLIVTVFGDFGEWLLRIPILIIAPLKFVAGLFIGVWAYTAANNLPAEPVAA